MIQVACIPAPVVNTGVAVEVINGMAYVDPNYKSKKEFIAAVKAGVQHRPYISGGMFDVAPNGTACIEGPHYPKPHKWYAAVTLKDGVVVTAK